jgi:ribosome-interacting GTPase 1
VEATLHGLGEARIEPATDNTGEAASGRYQKKMLIIGNKNDTQGSNNNWAKLNSQYNALFPVISVSASHKDFKDKLKYTMVWGSGKYDGQKVRKEHILRDGDIVEFHI